MTPYQDAVITAYRKRLPVFCHTLVIEGKRADNNQSTSLTLNGTVMRTNTRLYGTPKDKYPNGAQFMASGVPYTEDEFRFGDALIGDGTVIRMYSPGWFDNVGNDAGRVILRANVIGPSAFRTGFTGSSGAGTVAVSSVRVSQHVQGFPYKIDARGGSGDWLSQFLIFDPTLVENECMNDEPVDLTKNRCGY